MKAADFMEKAPDPPNERLIAAGLDGVVFKEAYAILAVRDEVDAPPAGPLGGWTHRRLGTPLKSIKGLACVDRAS